MIGNLYPIRKAELKIAIHLYPTRKEESKKKIKKKNKIWFQTINKYKT